MPNVSQHAKNDRSYDQSHAIPNEGFCDLQTILYHIPFCRASWLNYVKVGVFPAPIKLGPKRVVWRVEEIRDLIKRFSNQDAALLESMKKANCIRKEKKLAKQNTTEENIQPIE